MWCWFSAKSVRRPKSEALNMCILLTSSEYFLATNWMKRRCHCLQISTSNKKIPPALQPTDSFLALPISSENSTKVTIGVKRSVKLLPYHNFLGLNRDIAFSLSGIFNTLELQQCDSKDNATEQQAKWRKG